MNPRRRAPAITALGGLPAVLTLALVGRAGAHGTMHSPVSRTYVR